MVYDYQVSGLVIGCAIEVHKSLGPGLKERSYSAALCQALNSKNIRYELERAMPVDFQGVRVGSYRPDLIVENTVVVEVKSVDRLVPVFTSQVIRYLKISQLRVGLILNFNCPTMKEGVKRVVR